MKGCRPLTDPEIASILAHMASARYSTRDRCLVLLGLRTGFRISELLSLRRSHVWQNDRLVSRVYLERRHMKGKKASRELILHPEAQGAILELLKGLAPDPDTYLFQSRNGKNQALNRRTAWVILRKAAKACGLEGKVATHSMRKTFAKRVYEKSGGNMRKTQEALGHANINSTAAYIGVDQSEVDDLILKS